MTIESIAKICHEANRAYCATIGDASQLPWEESPDWQRQSAINGVKFAKAAEVKDLVFVSGKVVKAGAKSVTIAVKVERETKDGRELLVEGEFVFVAYDLTAKRAVEHGITLKESP